MAPPRTAKKQQDSTAPVDILKEIKAATGASEDDISSMLAECNYDVNEATSRLIWYSRACWTVSLADPFSTVVSKKDKRQQVRRGRIVVLGLDFGPCSREISAECWFKACASLIVLHEYLLMRVWDAAWLEYYLDTSRALILD